MLAYDPYTSAFLKLSWQHSTITETGDMIVKMSHANWQKKTENSLIPTFFFFQIIIENIYKAFKCDCYSI